jgi:hypothetical protein
MQHSVRLLLVIITLLGLMRPSLAAPTVATFTGGDPGEGLDLQGNFLYAVTVGPSGGAGKAGDANFSADNVAGVTVTAVNAIAPGGWGAADYGTTDNDKALSLAMNTIRWSPSPEVVRVQLKVEKGVEYKLQLLFHEDCCPGRGFNIVLAGKTELTDFMPGPTHTGPDGDFQADKNSIGAVVTHQFVAATDVFEIVLDGAAAESEEISDRNAILNGFTLERISPVTDNDSDGLRDDWEAKFFGNMDAKATDDPDNDGLTNLEEQTLGTEPNKADSDGDGLSDGDEVKVYKTDPTRVGDADGDLLTDGAEILIYKTDHKKVDSDGDGASDYYEVHALTDPNDPKSKPTKTTMNVFTGPAQGQGLDFKGNFIYAVAFANESPGGQIDDANFTADSVEGVVIESQSAADNWNVDVNFGDSPEQQVLTTIMSSIRWSDAAAATPNVTITLSKLQVGASYKMQMLFGERLWPRGFNVTLNDGLIAREFAPFQWQGGFVGPGGATPRTNGVVLTHTFVAPSTEAVIVLDGRPVRDPAISDHNAVVQALTLELLGAAVDSDGDGLWDAWETEVFGNLAQTGSGDADNDGLSNAQEFTRKTNPNNPDSDGDGLKDGEEVNTYKSNPTVVDSDGDGLPDGEEVNTYKTDPAKADTDGDGVPDAAEIRNGDNPIKAEPATKVANVVVGPFSGGDPGEGLDLQGNFRYAFNVSSAGAAGKAGDADFTADDAPGIKVTAANNIANWDTPDYGTSANDDVIEKVTQSIRYAPSVTTELTGLIPGSTYKLQLLFYEQCCAARGFNIYVDGVLVTSDFSPSETQGGVNNTAAGAVVSAEIATERHSMTIVCTVEGKTREDFTDPNAILDGVTLEVLKQGVVVDPKFTQVRLSSSGLVIAWDGGTLESADSITGPWSAATGMVSPATISVTGAKKFYRVK